MSAWGDRRLYGLVGHPVAHSLSPWLHSRFFAATGIAGQYVAFDVAPGDPESLISALETLGVQGVNLTIPWKEQIQDVLDHIDPEARAIGAVNTIYRQNERWHGANTDAPGFVDALEATFGEGLAGKAVVVLGAGGSARAVLQSCAASAASVVILNRDTRRAEVLARTFPRTTPGPLQKDRLEEALAGADLVVSALSGPGAAEVAAWGLGAPPPGLRVMDLNYGAVPTALLAWARRHDLPRGDGFAMLCHQAARAFERFTGARPALDLSRWRLEAGLGDPPG